MAKTTRVLISHPPYPTAELQRWGWRGRWPAEWIGIQGEAPFVAAYRLEISLDQAESRRVHVSADERYELFVNGERVGCGPERGEVDFWPFETYDLALAAGTNTIVARVWTLGADAPFAQMSLGHGFLFSPDDLAFVDDMATGVAKWQGLTVHGYTFKGTQQAWGTGSKISIDGRAYPWGFESGEGNWTEVKKLGIARFASGASDVPPLRQLIPATLPPMFDALREGITVRHVAEPATSETHATPIRRADALANEFESWRELLRGTSLTIPPHTRRRVLLDFDDYVCAYPIVCTSGGADAHVRIHWQETLFDSETSIEKGNRDQIEGKFFSTMWEWRDGIGDSFTTDGGAQREFTTLWWECGRYVEILVETQGEALTIDRLAFREDHYPIENEAPFDADDERLGEIAKLGFRTLQMCAHETYMDCPYFEQLQYVGDTRLQALVTFVTSTDDRLPRQALRAFDRSRRKDGYTLSRAPSRVVQVIPPFSLWWVCMVDDIARWRGDAEFIRSLMPGVRTVLDTFRATIVDGLVQGPVGWNYVDWVPGWKDGIPPSGEHDASGPINRQFELALRAAADVEEWLGEPELAARNRRNADEISHAIQRTFWSSERRMFADNAEKSSYSEHMQALSILAGDVPDGVAEGLLAAPDLHRATIYFSHYVLEAYSRIGRTDRILAGLDLWKSLLNKGLRTTIESPEPTRSDCHAWGAHPIVHFATNLLGIRPVGFGGGTFSVDPTIAGLTWARGGVATASGILRVDVQRDGIVIDVPSGVTVQTLRSTLSAGRHVLPRGGDR